MQNAPRLGQTRVFCLNSWMMIGRILFIGFLMAALLVLEASAQTSTDSPIPHKGWIKLGVGQSGGKQFSGFTGMVSVHYSTRFGIMGIRYLDSQDGSYYPAIFPSPDRINGFREVNMNLGYQVDVSMLNLSTSAGIGHVWGIEQTSDGDRRFSGVSFPIEAQVLIKPVRFLGIGVSMSASIMAKTTISSGMVVIQVGRF